MRSGVEPQNLETTALDAQPLTQEAQLSVRIIEYDPVMMGNDLPLPAPITWVRSGVDINGCLLRISTTPGTHVSFYGVHKCSQFV